MNSIQTAELKPGDCVRLLGFGQTESLYRQRLLSLGLTRGAEMRVIRKAPLGCPLQVEVRGVSISLRRDEASQLLWEPAR